MTAFNHTLSFVLTIVGAWKVSDWLIAGIDKIPLTRHRRHDEH